MVKIPEIVKSYELVENAGKDSLRRELTHYWKNCNGAIYCIEEVIEQGKVPAYKFLEGVDNSNDEKEDQISTKFSKGIQ